MKSVLNRISTNTRFSKPVLVSAVAVGISAVVIGFGVTTVVQSLLQPSIAPEDADPLKALAADSLKLLETSRKRFEGRSMYTLPPMPPRKTRVVEATKPIEPPKVDLGPPPPPATYTGPAPTSAVGKFVFFASLGEDNKIIKVGETKSGITVIAVEPPYSVKLGYLRGEYTVPLWAKAEERLTKGELAPSRVGGVQSVASASGSAGATAGLGSGGTTGGTAGSANPITTPGQAARPMPRRSPTSNPLTEPPGDQPGGDVPSGPGPEGEPQQLPSAAMLPQRIPAPGSGTSTPGQDFVDRETLPQRLQDDEIAGMTTERARAALQAIDATDSLQVDDHSRARLDHERALLRARLGRRP